MTTSENGGMGLSARHVQEREVRPQNIREVQLRVRGLQRTRKRTHADTESHQEHTQKEMAPSLSLTTTRTNALINKVGGRGGIFSPPASAARLLQQEVAEPALPRRPQQERHRRTVRSVQAAADQRLRTPKADGTGQPARSALQPIQEQQRAAHLLCCAGQCGALCVALAGVAPR